ncbi:hypothetical protein CEXT_115101 [Caerostris extrusa]|uniref:SCP domain-containing protein n=1 Tax=Caerostris extrusa TaxID=172846 RepID=A0AAV4QQM2_CAEEX|nr:hypothetical protein CEXT_115101 [Caerostris extrusa]
MKDSYRNEGIMWVPVMYAMCISLDWKMGRIAWVSSYTYHVQKDAGNAYRRCGNEGCTSVIIYVCNAMTGRQGNQLTVLWGWINCMDYSYVSYMQLNELENEIIVCE